jgi:hypothetical protein
MANLFAQAAFRHQASGTVYPTGAFHDIMRLPCLGEKLEEYDQGFLGHDGNFYTRAEAHKLTPQAKLLHDGKILHSQDLFRSEEWMLKKSVRDYTFDVPHLEGAVYVIRAHVFGGAVAGELSFQACADANPKSPSYGYHPIQAISATPEYGSKNLQGRLLQLGSLFVRRHLKSRGLVSLGVQPQSALLQRNEPGQKERLGGSDFEYERHEFIIALTQWLKRKSLGKSEYYAGNLGSVTHGDHGAATRMLGQSIAQFPEFKAARFMANVVQISDESLRLALLCYEDDLELAALFAYDLPRTEENRQALKALMAIQELSKSELEVAALPRLVNPGTPEARDVAESIRRAFEVKSVFPVKLGGVHSKGAAVAVDPQDGSKYLLKPGSGPRSPSAGENEQTASQSRMEAAFYHVAKGMGLMEFLPRAELLLIDQQEVAALTLLDSSYLNLNQLRKEPTFNKQKVFEPYRKNGTLFKWAVLDYICGNVDRHAGNLLINPDGDVKLIDHGSTFAGFGLSSIDSRTFVPAYLRAWSNHNFITLNAKERFREMPHPDQRTALALSDWIQGISLPGIVQTLNEYGILHDAVVGRLAALLQVRPEDRVEWVLGFWAGMKGSRPQS